MALLSACSSGDNFDFHPVIKVPLTKVKTQVSDKVNILLETRQMLYMLCNFDKNPSIFIANTKTQITRWDTRGVTTGVTQV